MQADNFTHALEYLGKIICGRLRIHLGQSEVENIDAPVFVPDGSLFTQFLNTHNPSFNEYVVLLLTLAPRLQPDLLTSALAEFYPNGGEFPAFGGIKGQNHRGILPTGETAQFLLGGNDLNKRLEVQQLFAQEHWFSSHDILYIEQLPPTEPPMSGRLLPDPEWVERITTGKVQSPRFSSEFPAEKIESLLSWDDLVLPDNTLEQVLEIETWLRHQQTLMDDSWGLGNRIKPGYRALFHGPPGTGKTLCAMLIGQRTKLEVFRIDLSMVVSKFIGETEKNLAKLFDKAQNKGWILFFDEADALFGKRTDIRDAHDKYANQEVSYLLQRIESFPGLVILASNFKNNLDDAFMRRFQSVVYFPMPDTQERLQLWEKTLPLHKAVLEDTIKLAELAAQYELTGAAILNVVQYACLQSLERGANILIQADLLKGIRRELGKEGKIIS